MKKTFALGLGLALIGASVISFSDASRDAYHVYMYQQGRQVTAPQAPQHRQRAFSRRMGAYTRPRAYRRDTERYGVNPSKNTRYLQGDIRNRASVPRAQLETPISDTIVRQSTGRYMGGTQLNSHRKASMTFKRTADAVEKFTTYENETFSLELPFGWRASNENAHLFQHPRSDYTIAVKHIEKKCDNTGFMACAITLSKNENHKNPAEKIAVTGKIERQSQFFGTVLNTPLQTRTYTEGFSAEIGGKDIYIARYFVADLDGGVYIVETRTALKNAAQFIGVSKRVFESFQLFSTQK